MTNTINPIIILGAKDEGKRAYEIFEANNVVIYGLLDEDKELHEKEYASVVVLGDVYDEGFTKLIGNKCDAFVAIDDVALRKDYVKLLNERRKVQSVNAFHPNALLSEHSSIGHGIMIDALTLIQNECVINNHSYLGSNSVIQQQSTIGEYCTIGNNVVIGKNCIIDDEVFIGDGAIIVSNIQVGKGARIGAGSVVVNEVKARKTVFGNPAQEVK